MMGWISFLIVLINCIIAQGGDFQGSKFYQDIYSQEYSCSVHFEEPMRVECACVTGLWMLYESCSENITLAGDDTKRCIRLSGAPIAKAIKVLNNREELAIISSTGSITELKQENAVKIEIHQDMALVTGSDWTLLDKSGTRICLSVIEPESYCFFSNKESSHWEIDGIERGCNRFDYFLDPSKCEAVDGYFENICEMEDPYPVRHTIVKRQANLTDTVGEGNVNGSTGGHVTALAEEDEDYHILKSSSTTNGSTNGTDPTVIIADGILDFMDTILDELLGFPETPETDEAATVEPNGVTTPPLLMAGGGAKPGSFESEVRVKKNADGIRGGNLFVDEELYTNTSNPNPLNVTYSNPAYEFLEISKRVTQKTCPSFYVKPSFLNLAVSTFIRLQQIEFKFPETSFKPAGFRRVLDSLRKCEQFASQFNFTDANCDGKVDGNYTAYGKTIELTVTAEYANFNRDPIIETVWKVFFNAHSYCYPFFNKTLDHHRFTTWMIPLFQNQANDIWTAGKTTEDSLNGLFGNQIQVQGNLAYCAVSSRLGSSYPWDLPRPARVLDFGPSVADGNSAGKGRRKRDVDSDSYLTRMKPGNCLDSSKSMLCPSHVQSIVSQ